MSPCTKERVAMPASFTSFRNSYLFVYSLMMAGDWLQAWASTRPFFSST
jgi:hypothetical protein